MEYRWIIFALFIVRCGAEDSPNKNEKDKPKEASYQAYTISNLVTFRSPNSSKEAQPLGHIKIDLDIIPLSEFSKDEKSILQYFHLQYVDEKTTKASFKARNLTGYPYLVQLDIDDTSKRIVPTFYFDKRENPISRNFKRELSNFVIALKGRQRDNNKKVEPTQIDPSPIERRTFETSIISGLDDKTEEDRSYHNLTLSTKLFTPWTETPLHEVDHMIFMVQTLEAVKDAYENVTSLQQPTIHDTVGMFPQLKMEDEGLATFDLLETQRRLITPDKATTLTNLLKSTRKYTLKSKAATRKAGQVFLILHATAERSTKEELVTALKDSLTLKKKQASTTLFLIDVLASLGTKTALEAVQEVLDYKSKPAHLELFRRYVVMSSFATVLERDGALIKSFMKFLDEKDLDANLQEAFALSIGALGYIYNRKIIQCATASRCGTPKPEALQLLEVISTTLALNLAKCKEPNKAQCEIIWLRAIGNFGFPKTLPAVLHHMELGGRPGAAAIRALRRLDTQDEDIDELLESVWKIYESADARYDSNCKIAAVDWLVKQAKMCPSGNSSSCVDIVARLLNGVAGLKTDELRTYVVAALKDGLGNPKLFNLGVAKAMKKSRNVLKELMVKGQSVVYDGLLASSAGLNSTYNLAMEFGGGTMKSSAVGVSVTDAYGKPLPIILSGLYSRGLGSFMGAKDEDKDETATAGLNLELLDVSLPSVVFFNGMGELMSMAMSAGGDDPVAEMQFNFLVLNDGVPYYNPNGVIIYTKTKSAVSADLAGFVDISLWGRTSKSLVQNTATIVTEHKSDVIFLGQVMTTQTVTEVAAGQMDFVTNVDFSNFPVKMCMQMTNSPVFYRRHATYKAIQDDGKEEVKQIRLRSMTQPKSFNFGTKNTEYCSRI